MLGLCVCVCVCVCVCEWTIELKINKNDTTYF